MEHPDRTLHPLTAAVDTCAVPAPWNLTLRFPSASAVPWPACHSNEPCFNIAHPLFFELLYGIMAFFFIAQNEMAVFISKLKLQIFQAPQRLALRLRVQRARLRRAPLRTGFPAPRASSALRLAELHARFWREGPRLRAFFAVTCDPKWSEACSRQLSHALETLLSQTGAPGPRGMSSFLPGLCSTAVTKQRMCRSRTRIRFRSARPRASHGFRGHVVPHTGSQAGGVF